MNALTQLRRLPWWLSLVLGAGAILLGLSLLAKPFDSLRVLVLLVGTSFVVSGISDIASARDRPGFRLAFVSGIAWIIAGIVVLAWPGISIKALAIVTGINLIVSGAIKLVTSLRGTVDDRIITGISGLARGCYEP